MKNNNNIQGFDPYNDNIDLADFAFDDDNNIEEINEFNSVPTVNRLNGGNYKYDDEQWD